MVQDTASQDVTVQDTASQYVTVQDTASTSTAYLHFRSFDDCVGLLIGVSMIKMCGGYA